jgi:hypothetical protein
VRFSVFFGWFQGTPQTGLPSQQTLYQVTELTPRRLLTMQADAVHVREVRNNDRPLV